MATTCPSCGQKASGRFCSHCGASLEAERSCQACGNPIPPGGRFCNMCGTPVTGVPAHPLTSPPIDSSPASPVTERKSNLPWFVAGAALLALIAVLIGPRLRSSDSPAEAGPPFTGPVAGGDPSSVDLGSMTPQEAALRLFNRVMEAASAGDSAQARAFAPMAVAAYDRVPTKSLDDRYHIAAIHLVNRDPAAARAAADTILAEVPTHLFALATAAEAAIQTGDADEARDLYERLLANFESEVATNRQEYLDHQAILPTIRSEAQSYVEGSN